jgi:predicted nucleic acid-binding Zn ribbon protein
VSERPEAVAGLRGEAGLGSLLEAVLGRLGLGLRFREHLAAGAWAEIAGRVVGAHTRAEGVRDGVLVVATDSAAWAQELQMRQGELLARLSARVGPGVVREIHFRSGRERQRGRAKRGPRPAEVRLSRRHEQQVRRAAGHIEDADLRARAEGAFLAVARMAEWRRQNGWRPCRRCGQWQRVGRRWCSSCTHSGERRSAR